MLRRVACGSTLVSSSAVRCVSSYDTKMLAHNELLQRYKVREVVADAHAFAEAQLIPSLEAVEQRVAMWRLNRWELRIPPLLSGREREQSQQQLYQIRKHMSEQCEILERAAEDKSILMRSLGLKDIGELEGQSRAWLQSRVDALRWEGRVADAKEAREAWIRLEKYGNRDNRLLERVCAVYGMARLNTFSDAFTNFVSEDGSTKKLILESEDPFKRAVSMIVTSMPTIDICYDFLGLSGNGYTSALKRYLRYVLVASQKSQAEARELATHPAGSRLLYSSPDAALLDLTQVNPNPDDAGDARHGAGDMVFIRNGLATFISVASSNKHVRSLQIPSRRQMEGVARRLSLTLDLPLRDVKVQFLYLPPNAIDSASLARLHRMIGLDGDVTTLSGQGFVPEWSALYDRELPVDEVDYVEIQKKFPEEEWVML